MKLEYENGHGEKTVVEGAKVVEVGPREPVCKVCSRRVSYQSMEWLPERIRCKKCGRK